jgi:hypothetical protein
MAKAAVPGNGSAFEKPGTRRWRHKTLKSTSWQVHIGVGHAA